jgi:YHS domain-containing protein
MPALLAASLIAALSQAPTGPAATPPLPGATPNLEAGALPNRTLLVDPVLLRSGTTTAGDPGRFVDFEGNRYLFSNEESRSAFLGSPSRFAARDGGACGRMGPLGGLGDARLYALEGELLYFFASKACMDRFRANPSRYMEAYDILPTGTPEQQVAGLSAVDRWVSWCGGRDAVESAERYSHRSVRDVEQAGAQWQVEEIIEIDGPRTMRSTKNWRRKGGRPDEVTTTRIETTPEVAVISGSNGTMIPLVPTRREAFERMLNRLPYSILRARFRPEAGFLALKSGEGRLGPHDCDFVQTWFEGNRTALAIDRSSGRLVQIGYTGRLEAADAAVLTLYRDVLADGPKEVLRLPTKFATYPHRADEGACGTSGADAAGSAEVTLRQNRAV